MLPIAICDDEPLQRQQTAEVIRLHGTAYEPVLREFASAEELINAIHGENYTPRIAVLDIQMKEQDGISLAQALNQLIPQCAVIFLTSYLDFATEVYQADHVYFILKQQLGQHRTIWQEHSAKDFASYESYKRAGILYVFPPFITARMGQKIGRRPQTQLCGDALEDKIDMALERAIQHHHPEPPFLEYRCGSAYCKVPCREILYLERVLHRTRVKKMTSEDWIRDDPCSLLQGRLAPVFLRCHQSYWVNKFQITTLDKSEFILSDGTHIPISRTYRDRAKEDFFLYLSSVRL